MSYRDTWVGHARILKWGHSSPLMETEVSPMGTDGKKL